MKPGDRVWIADDRLWLDALPKDLAEVDAELAAVVINAGERLKCFRINPSTKDCIGAWDRIDEAVPSLSGVLQSLAAAARDGEKVCRGQACELALRAEAFERLASEAKEQGR